MRKLQPTVGITGIRGWKCTQHVEVTFIRVCDTKPRVRTDVGGGNIRGTLCYEVLRVVKVYNKYIEIEEYHDEHN